MIKQFSIKSFTFVCLNFSKLEIAIHFRIVQAFFLLSVCNVYHNNRLLHLYSSMKPS